MSGPRRSDPPEPDTIPIPVQVPPRPSDPDTRTQPWYAARRPTAPRPQPPAARPASTPIQPAPPPAPDDAPVRSTTERRRNSKVSLLIGSGLAALVIAAASAVILGRWQFAHSHTTEVGVNDAELGVQQVLSDPINGYGRDNVTVVRCNNGRNPTVRKGGSFTCQVSVDGAERKVTAVFSDDAGTYQVDRPR